MVLVRVREWEEAALERKKNQHIQSGKLKQQLPEQAVEASSANEGRKEGRRCGGKENDRVTKASLTHCHTPPHTPPHTLGLDPFLSEPIHSSPLISSWHFLDMINEMTLKTVVFIVFPPASFTAPCSRSSERRSHFGCFLREPGRGRT